MEQILNATNVTEIRPIRVQDQEHCPATRAVRRDALSSKPDSSHSAFLNFREHLLGGQQATSEDPKNLWSNGPLPALKMS